MRGARARRTAVSIVLTAVAVTTVTTGCTSDEGAPEPTHSPAPATLARLRAAEQATERAASAKVRSTTVMGGELALTADGALRWRDGLTGTLTITYTGGRTAETMRGLGVTSMEARYLPDAYYAHMGEEFARKAGGKPWIRYAYDDLDALGGGTDFDDQMRNTTPSQSVRLLLDADDLRGAGQETVDGRRTTHYTGTVDVTDVSDAELRGQLQRAGMTGGTIDIWLDEQNLVVKKVERGHTATGAYTQTASYSDYGTDVVVAAPPSGETADFTQLTPKA
ncbi:hypothetical protein [Streptomyces sp. NPDC018693]|uniref:hypothetical protein n=1 Tax=unclassified Streptomyces TaxID=2593676 RepID=UPI0037AB6F03